MPSRKTRKKATRRKAGRRGRPGRLESTWSDTQKALRAAEANISRRVAALVERSGVDTRRLMRQAERWRARLDREGRKARKRVEAGLAELQQRTRRDRRTLTRTVDEAVARALAALNIPSRREVQQLSRRVEQLSKRVQARRR